MCSPCTKRVRGGIGGVDADSDEEVEIDTSATLTSGGIGIHYTEHVSKRQKHSHASGHTLLGSSTDFQKSTAEEPIESQPSTKGKRKQGASVTMAMFSSEFLVLQESILLKSYHKDVGSTCRCGSNPALFRCAGQEYCFGGRLQCGACIVQQHKWLPFHRIEKWDGKTFVAHSLKELGYVLYLGHCGEKCVNLSETTPPRPMVIVHTNGYHRMLVHFCHCANALSESIQLCDEQLFPATLLQPRTVFTFSVLDNCHIHLLSSKKPMGDFHDALVKMTSPAFPQDIPNRYVMMTHIYRVWIHLALVRRRGQTHGIDKVLLGRQADSLAVRCPACPEIGFNVDKSVIEDASEYERHKYTLFVSADGNFRLQRKHKNDDPDDCALNGGRAYFVENEKYQEYLGFIENTKDVCPILSGSVSNNKLIMIFSKDCGCQHLQANRLQNVVKFKNAVVSGVVAIVCARHAFYLPQGMVDLQKGEAFANTDYALVHSLADAGHHRWIMVSYDIWCSYHVNLKKRFAKFFPNAADLLNHMRGAIPKMHIKNHLEACQLLWAFNYLYGSGETCGEQIETAWSEGNQAAASTKEMNEGHRHDILDEYHGYWNWTKTHKLGLYIALYLQFVITKNLFAAAAQYNAYTRCLDVLKKREMNFCCFEASMTKENVQKWQGMDDHPHMENKEVISVHTAKFKNFEGPPTQDKAYKSLLQQELENNISASNTNKSVGKIYFINHGLKLEHDQVKVAVLSSSVQTAAQTDLLLKMRIKLHQDLIDWRKLQYEYCPFLNDCIDAVDPNTPELTNLFLPSSFQGSSDHGVTELAKLEYELRLGQAYDALDEVRTKIKIFNANLAFKKDNVFGQRPNTRAQQYLKTLSADKVNAADKYRQARQALLNLGLSKDDQSLRPLHDHELWGKNASRLARLGDTKKEEPWFWTVGMPSKLSEAEQTEWSVELDRVKYFRDRAACDRAKEEKEILEAEMDRIVSSFSCMKTTWHTMAEVYRKPACSCMNLDGKECMHTCAQSAYAFKQVKMYERFEKDAEERRKNIKIKGDSLDQWLQSKDYPFSNDLK